MRALTVPASVRAQLGREASEGIVEMFTLYNELAAARYERRLSEELGALRVELHALRSDMFKWAFVFWAGQFVAVTGALALMLRH